MKGIFNPVTLLVTSYRTHLLLGTADGMMQIPFVLGTELRLTEAAASQGLMCAALVLTQRHNAIELLVTVLALEGTWVTRRICLFSLYRSVHIFLCVVRVVVIVLLLVVVIVVGGFVEHTALAMALRTLTPAASHVHRVQIFAKVDSLAVLTDEPSAPFPAVQRVSTVIVQATRFRGRGRFRWLRRVGLQHGTRWGGWRRGGSGAGST